MLLPIFIIETISWFQTRVSGVLIQDRWTGVTVHDVCKVKFPSRIPPRVEPSGCHSTRESC